MDLVRTVTDLLASFEFCGNVRIPCCSDQGREPVEAGNDSILHLASRHLAGPANDHRYSETTFQCRSFAASERSLAAIWPSEVLSSVVRAEGDDGVVIQAVVFQVLHDRADDVVQLRHSGFLNRPP